MVVLLGSASDNSKKRHNIVLHDSSNKRYCALNKLDPRKSSKTTRWCTASRFLLYFHGHRGGYQLLCAPKKNFIDDADCGPDHIDKVNGSTIISRPCCRCSHQQRRRSYWFKCRESVALLNPKNDVLNVRNNYASGVRNDPILRIDLSSYNSCGTCTFPHCSRCSGTYSESTHSSGTYSRSNNRG